MAHSEAVYELTKAAEEDLSADVWKWKLHALICSRRFVTQSVEMPVTRYLDLSKVSETCCYVYMYMYPYITLHLSVQYTCT